MIRSSLPKPPGAVSSGSSSGRSGNSPPGFSDAELEHLELAAVVAHPPLAEEHGPAERDRDGDRAGDHHRRQEQEDAQRAELVEGVLDRELPAARIARVRRDQRQPAEVLDREALGHLLEQARDERDVDPQLLAAVDDAQEHLVGSGREGHDHLADVVLGDDPVEVPARAEHRHAQRAVLEDERLLVEEADRPQAQVGVLEQPLGRHPADVPGADDQGRHERLALLSRPDLPEVDDDAPAGDEQRRAETEPDRLAGGDVGCVVDEDAQGDDQAGRDREHPAGRADVVEGFDLRAPAVGALDVGHDDDDQDEDGRPQQAGLDAHRPAAPQIGDRCGENEQRDIDADTNPGPEAGAVDGSLVRIQRLERGRARPRGPASRDRRRASRTRCRGRPLDIGVRRASGKDTQTDVAYHFASLPIPGIARARSPFKTWRPPP